MKVKKTRLIFFILTIATFITICIFSNQNGEESGETSRGFTKIIIEALPIAKDLDEGRKAELIENAQTVVRKLAHFSIYTVLGINLMGFMNTYKRLKQKPVISTFFCIIILSLSIPAMIAKITYININDIKLSVLKKFKNG